MATVKISFDPATLDETSEAWPAFNAGGMTLTIWALYKRRFITSQHFRAALCNLATYFEEAYDADIDDVQPYSNIDQFVGVLTRCGFHAGGYGSVGLAQWAAELWDYFSLNIQRAVTLEYEVVEPVIKQMRVTGEALKDA